MTLVCGHRISYYEQRDSTLVKILPKKKTEIQISVENREEENTASLCDCDGKHDKMQSATLNTSAACGNTGFRQARTYTHVRCGRRLTAYKSPAATFARPRRTISQGQIKKTKQRTTTHRRKVPWRRRLLLSGLSSMRAAGHTSTRCFLFFAVPLLTIATGGISN